MSTIGPKGPADPALAKVLQLRRPTTEQSGKVGQAPVAPPQVAPPSAEPAAVFTSTPSGTQPTLVASPVEGAALSQLIARLRAKGEQTSAAVVSGPTVLTTDEGKVLSGSVQVEGKAGLKLVDGSARIGGSFSISGVVKNGDLLALSSVRVIEGRFTVEGLRSKAPSQD